MTIFLIIALLLALAGWINTTSKKNYYELPVRQPHVKDVSGYFGIEPKRLFVIEAYANNLLHELKLRSTVQTTINANVIDIAEKLLCFVDRTNPQHISYVWFLVGVIEQKISSLGDMDFGNPMIAMVVGVLTPEQQEKLGDAIVELGDLPDTAGEFLALVKIVRDEYPVLLDMETFRSRLGDMPEADGLFGLSLMSLLNGGMLDADDLDELVGDIHHHDNDHVGTVADTIAPPQGDPGDEQEHTDRQADTPLTPVVADVNDLGTQMADAGPAVEEAHQEAAPEPDSNVAVDTPDTVNADA